MERRIAFLEEYLVHHQEAVALIQQFHHRKIIAGRKAENIKLVKDQHHILRIILHVKHIIRIGQQMRIGLFDETFGLQLPVPQNMLSIIHFHSERQRILRLGNKIGEQRWQIVAVFHEKSRRFRCRYRFVERNLRCGYPVLWEVKINLVYIGNAIGVTVEVFEIKIEEIFFLKVCKSKT